jgi:hypothetical protein
MMEISDFDEPALLMKLGGESDASSNPSLGHAILYVMGQPSADRWQFDIVTEVGLLSSNRIGEIAGTPIFALWTDGRRAAQA